MSERSEVPKLSIFFSTLVQVYQLLSSFKIILSETIQILSKKSWHSEDGLLQKKFLTKDLTTIY